MEEQYTNGKYWEENGSFHEKESDFKFQNFKTLIERNDKLPIIGIVDMGCGAGRIIWNFSNAYPAIKWAGVDLSEKIIEYAKGKYNRNNLSYFTATAFNGKEGDYNLVILADVFEHIENYIGFLKDIKTKYQFQVFNIPLDLSIRYLLNDRPLQMRKSVGHLHYFYDKLILKILEETGFTVIDYLYANNLEIETKNATGISKYSQVVRKYLLKVLVKAIGESLASKLYGGFSLTVLCKRKED